LEPLQPEETKEHKEAKEEVEVEEATIWQEVNIQTILKVLLKVVTVLLAVMGTGVITSLPKVTIIIKALPPEQGEISQL
jgi:hypothetical protein